MNKDKTGGTYDPVRHISTKKGANTMGFFSTILEKLGLKKEAPAASQAATSTATPAPVKPAASATAATVKPSSVSSAGTATVRPSADQHKDDDIKHQPSAAAEAKAPAVQAISEVDVVKKLEQMAEGSGLNWKVSIVDLLKILGIDSSREARNELAKELGCPDEFMHDSAKMNVWLHKEVLKQIAANGGNIPQSLLD
jgi:hypothetical protein